MSKLLGPQKENAYLTYRSALGMKPAWDFSLPVSPTPLSHIIQSNQSVSIEVPVAL